MRTLIIILVLLIQTSAFAQFEYVNLATGLTPTVNDARARAMGRTEITSTYGANSLFANPANLGFVENMEVHLSSRSLFGSINDKDYWDLRPQETMSESYPFNLKLTQLSFIYPYYDPKTKNRAALAIGFNDFLDWGFTYKGEYENQESEYTETEDRKNTGGIRNISIAGALNLNNKLAFGIGLSRTVLGKLKIVTEFDTDYYPPYSNYYIKRTREYYLETFNITLGATFKPNKKLAIGMLFKPGFHITVDKYKYITTYPDGNTYSDSYSRDTEVKIPPIYGVGVTATPLNSMLLAVEYQNRPYADCKYESGNRLFRDIKNGHSFRVGFEYQTKYPIRLGFFNEAIPITDENSGSEKPKSLTGFTAGTGIESGNVRADIYGEYAYWKYQKFEASDPPMYGEYSESLISIGITLTMKFPKKSKDSDDRY